MDTKKSITVFILICLLVGAVMISSSQSVAQAKNLADADGVTMPYSWTLTDAQGKAAKDGVYAFTFALYDTQTGGTLLWSEQQSNVKVSGGKVNVELGVVTPIPALLLEEKDAKYWLAVSVRSSTERSFTDLSPRQAMRLSPQSPEALTCPHNHFTDYWGGTSSSYGLEVDNGTGTGDGVRGYSGSTLYNYAGVYAVNGGGTTAGGGGSGVYGYSSNGYGGYFESGNYRGLYAKGNPTWYAGFFENPSGSTNVGLYVNGTLYVTGSKSGYIVDVAYNDGAESLETGDVVEVVGYDDPVSGEIPVVKVRKSGTADSTGVVGIVDQPFNVPEKTTKSGDPNKELPGVSGTSANKVEGTGIGQGQYMTIVTLGSFKAIKVDASFGAIEPGDLLVSSSNPGYAMVSHDPKVGTVIGKALGELASGTGMIPVLVVYQ